MIEEYQFNRIRLFVEPRCCTFVTAAIIGGAVSLVGTGVGAASAAGAFSPNVTEPNTGAEATQMEELQAQYLPAILGMEAAAQEGGQYTIPADIAQALEAQGVQPPGTATVNPQLASQLASLQQQLASTPPTVQGAPESSHGIAGSTMPNPAYTALQNQIQGLQQQLNNGTVNFAGQGTAQTQGQIEQQLAQGQLQEGQQYDPQFIATQLAEEQQANPQQFAARQAEYNMLQQAIQNPQTSPVSNTLQNQVTGQVAAGSSLTPQEQQMLNAAVASSNASGQGGTGGAAPDFENALTTGFAGQERALQNASTGAGFLQSGETPADIAYRQQQADIGDLGAYAGGQTPEAQFGEISGAGQPVAPEYQTSYQPSYAGAAAAQQGEAGAINEFGQNVDQQLNQPNPWTLGLSTVLQGVNTAANAGAF